MTEPTRFGDHLADGLVYYAWFERDTMVVLADRLLEMGEIEAPSLDWGEDLIARRQYELESYVRRWIVKRLRSSVKHPSHLLTVQPSGIWPRIDFVLHVLRNDEAIFRSRSEEMSGRPPITIEPLPLLAHVDQEMGRRGIWDKVPWNSAGRKRQPRLLLSPEEQAQKDLRLEVFEDASSQSRATTDDNA